MSPVLISALVAAAVGATGLAVVLALSRRSIRAAAVAAPGVVVLAMASGVVASVRTMAINESAAGTIGLVLVVTVAVAVVTGWIQAWQLGLRDRAAIRAAAALERDRQIETRRRELVSWMSHDLRTPLAGITAMTEALQDGVAPQPQVYLSRLHDEALRLDAMVGDLLALSRLQSPTGPRHVERVSMRDLVSEVVERLAPVAARAGVRLSGAADTEAPVRVDPDEMSRAVSNLVANAIQHTPHGDQVRVVVEAGGAAVTVSVSDCCGGIPEDHLPHVFEAGWRGTEARSPGAGVGAGLGLAIVAGVAENHRGEVTVRNAGPGCVFSLRIPAASLHGGVQLPDLSTDVRPGPRGLGDVR